MRKICIVVLVLLLLVGCTPQQKSTNKNTIVNEEFTHIKAIENELKGEYDGVYIIPFHPEYELLHIHLVNSPSFLTMPPEMVVYYGLNKGDLIETFDDSDFIKRYEERLGKSFYGFYEGDIIAQLSYSPIKGGEIDGDHIWSIDGYDIPYAYIGPEENKIYTGIGLEQGGYRIIFTLRDYFTEEDAKAFTAFVLNEVKP